MSRVYCVFAILFASSLVSFSDDIPGAASSFREYSLKTPIVTNAVQAVQSTVGPIAAKVANVSAYDGATSTYTNKNGDAKQDYRVLIGANTISDGDDGTHGQSIVIGRDAQSHGCASCALGPNSETDDEGYGISIGWRSISVKSGSIAIGCGTKSGQNYWLDSERTQHNPQEQSTAAVGVNSISIGRGTRAENDSSIAIGAKAKANANGAIQLGEGNNTEANTLKFQGTTIVKDGKVVGTFDPADLDPQVIEIDDSCIVTAKSHSVTTIECPTNNAASTYPEIEVYPSSSRNYELFIDNSIGNRKNLPLMLNDDGANLFINAQDGMIGPFLKLPIMLKSKEPKPGRVLIEVECINDGYAWNPTITNVQSIVDITSGFKVDVNQILGTELHFLTNWSIKLTYGTDVSFHKIDNVNALYSTISFGTSFSTNEIPDSASIYCQSEGFTREEAIYTRE